jgi:hypothetical protein
MPICPISTGAIVQYTLLRYVLDDFTRPFENGKGTAASQNNWRCIMTKLPFQSTARAQGASGVFDARTCWAKAVCPHGANWLKFMRRHHFSKAHAQLSGCSDRASQPFEGRKLKMHKFPVNSFFIYRKSFNFAAASCLYGAKSEKNIPPS